MKKTAEKKVVEKKAVARRPAKAKDNLLLAREHKQVFKDGDSVLKVFDANYKVSAILNEAMNEARAAETGLPFQQQHLGAVFAGSYGSGQPRRASADNENINRTHSLPSLTWFCRR